MATYKFTTPDISLWPGPPAAINDAGDVVGFAIIPPPADAILPIPAMGLFIDSNGTVTTVADPNSSFFAPSHVTGLNDHGQAVGYTSTLDGGAKSYIYQNGTFTTLPDPTATSTPIPDPALDALQQLIGDNLNSLLSQFGGGLFSFPIPDGATSTVIAYDINNDGDVVGTYLDTAGAEHGFIYDGTAYIAFDDPLATKGTVLTGINDSDDLVGYYLDDSGTHYFLYDNGGTFENGTFTPIIDPHATGNSTSVVGIDNAGAVVGNYTDAADEQHGFIYYNGHYTTIDYPSATVTASLLSVSSDGDILGIAQPEELTETVQFSGNTQQVLSLPVPAAPGQFEFVTGINTAGVIVGYTENFVGDLRQAFIDDHGAYTALPSAPGGVPVTPLDINDSGEIVGSQGAHGFTYIGGTYTTLDVPDATATTPEAVNNAGVVVGAYDDGDIAHGFIDNHGSFTTLDAPGAVATAATGINSAGDVVGFYADSTFILHGFLYHQGTYTTIDAPDIQYPLPFHGQSTFLSGIDDAGNIVGVTVLPVANFMDVTYAAQNFVYSGGTFTILNDADVPNALSPILGSPLATTLPFEDPTETNQLAASFGPSTSTDGTVVAQFAIPPALFFSANSTPQSPTQLQLASVSNSGVKSDTTTSDTTPTITGSAIIGDLVTLYDGSTVLGSATIGSSGRFSITPTGTLSDGVHTITATQTDAATGAISPASTALALTIDTTPPAPPANLSLDPTTDSGVVGDGITRDTAPRITGTGVAGDTITLKEGSTVLGTGTVAGNGKWSILSNNALSAGTHILSATDTEPAAGNVSAAATLTITIDTSAPPRPTHLSLDPASDSGTAGDGITNVAQPTIDGQGEAGDTITLRDGALTIGSGTVANDGTWSITVDSPLSEGTHTLTAKATDVAGNTSTNSVSAAFSVTIDTGAPAPSGLALDPSTDSGTLGDGITSFTQVEIDGQGEAGDTVKLYDGATLVGSGTVGSDGGWQIITTSALASGLHSLTAKETDGNGNTSAASSPALVVTIAAPPPAPSGLALDPSTDSDTIGDGATSFTQVVIDGQGQAGDTVNLYDGATLISSGTVGSDGGWQITTSALASGPRSLTAKQTDGNGDTSAASSPALGITIVAATASLPITISGSNQTIIGDGSNNTIIATGANNQIIVYVGANVLTAAGDFDTVIGGIGPDTITAMGTGDIVKAGSGDQVITVTGTSDVVFAGSGTNTIDVSGLNDSVVGGSGPAVITVTGTGDTVTGGSGNNLITVTGTSDVVIGGSGANTISVSGLNDAVVGGSGPGVITATGTGDTVTGGGGSNSITVTGTADVVFGGSGTDTIDVWGLNDSVTGGSGPDKITIWGTNDTLTLGTGLDMVTVAGVNDVIQAGTIGNTTSAQITLLGSGTIFVDGPNTYADTVVGFSQAAGDTIELSSSGHTVASSQQLNGGADTLITLSSSSTILLTGISHINPSFFS